MSSEPSKRGRPPKPCEICKDGTIILKIKSAITGAEESFEATFNFCPNCGRKMGDKNE